MEERNYHLLPKGRKLNNRYVIENVLGEGGFGITYEGMDTLLDVRVAIKEFFPQNIVTRNNSIDDLVTISRTGQNDAFQKGKKRFLEEAKIIAKFKAQDGIVDVMDFFEANNTVYIVMEYLDGITLQNYIKENGPVDLQDMIEMSVPILESLDEVHRQGLIHRDISPDNIMLLQNGKIKLMDFGAARDYTGFGEKSLSIVLKPGYAPEEQYRSKGVQGPWTDIYAFSATIYKAITGVTPDESMERVIEDTLKKPSELGIDIPSSMENAIMKGLNVFPKDRYQNLGDFCLDLYGDGKKDTGEESSPAQTSSSQTSYNASDQEEEVRKQEAGESSTEDKKENIEKTGKKVIKGCFKGCLIVVILFLVFFFLLIFLGAA